MLKRGALLIALSDMMYSHQATAQEHSILTYHGDARRSGNFVVPNLGEGAKLERPLRSHGYCTLRGLPSLLPDRFMAAHTTCGRRR